MNPSSLLGREHFVTHWVLAGYDFLVRHSEKGPYNDAERIGYKVANTLWMCRETKLFQNDAQYLQSAFKDEIQALETQEKQHKLDDMDVDEQAIDISDSDDLNKRLQQTKADLDKERQGHAAIKTELAQALEQLEDTWQKLEKTRLRAAADLEQSISRHSSTTADLDNVKAALE